MISRRWSMLIYRALTNRKSWKQNKFHLDWHLKSNLTKNTLSYAPYFSKLYYFIFGKQDITFTIWCNIVQHVDGKYFLHYPNPRYKSIKVKNVNSMFLAEGLFIVSSKRKNLQRYYMLSNKTAKDEYVYFTLLESLGNKMRKADTLQRGKTCKYVTSNAL